MKKEIITKGLGTAFIDDKAYIFVYNAENAHDGIFSVRKSDDGISFETVTVNAKIISSTRTPDDLSQCAFFHVSRSEDFYYITYKIRGSKKLLIARSKNLVDWVRTDELNFDVTDAKIVTDYLYDDKNVIYTGGNCIKLCISKDFKKWTCIKKKLITINKKKSKGKLLITDVQITDNGIFVTYARPKEDSQGIIQYSLYGALFSYVNPTELLWHSEISIYKTRHSADNKALLFGTILFDDYLVSYWTGEDNNLFLMRHSYKLIKNKKKKGYELQDAQYAEEAPVDNFKLDRAPENPILSPQSYYPWESRATYNPTAIEADGITHIIYRADGDDFVSVWGYASTIDGITIKDRSTQCIFQEKRTPMRTHLPSPVSYSSGSNTNGGCEDPRAVLIEGVVYVTFTAFNGWDSIRVALTSISFDDFKNQRWHKWKKTIPISPPGEPNKNWVLFPEKVNGKFAIMHSFYPKILIDYFDDLAELDGKTKFIKSNNTRPVDHSRTWDSWFRGVGPAPLRIKDGWLVFYHAMDHRNPTSYQLGALILDYNDPTKILYRSKSPILVPEEHYENGGIKKGVIYSCGAVIKKDTLFIYYGGSDEFVCVATAPIKQFLSDLKQTGGVKLTIN